MSAKEADCEDDLYPEIDWISFGDIAVSDEIWNHVHDEIYEKLPQ